MARPASTRYARLRGPISTAKVVDNQPDDRPLDASALVTAPRVVS